MHDNRNSHRAETEVGLRLVGQPSRRWNAVSYFGTPPFRIPVAGRPQPALTALAFVAGAMVSRVAGDETDVLGCLKPAATYEPMQKVLGSCFD
jgi:hypothetical protein